MTPNEGKKLALEGLQAMLYGLYVELIDSPATITKDTIWSDLSFASWSGYSPWQVSSLSAVTIVSDRARCNAVSPATFGNTSGVSQTAYGWAVVDTAANKILSAAMFDVPLIIPNGETRNVPANFFMDNLVIA